MQKLFKTKIKEKDLRICIKLVILPFLIDIEWGFSNYSLLNLDIDDDYYYFYYTK